MRRLLVSISTQVLYLEFTAMLAVTLAVSYACDFDTLFSRYLPHRLVQLACVLALALGFLAVLLVRGVGQERGMPWLGGRALPAGLAVAVLLGTGSIATLALQSVPLSGDEGAYTLQAEMLAAGQVSAELTPVQPYLAQTYIFPANGRLISQYPPGWPAVLAAGQALGLPMVLVNPLLGAATILALWWLAARCHGREVAGIAAGLCAVSAFFLFNSASFYNGSVTALFGVLFVGTMCRFLDQPGNLAAAAVGVLFSVLASIRHFDALLFALPAACAFLWRARARHWRCLPSAALAALPIMGLVLWYYRGATGRWFLVPQVLRDPNDGLFGANWFVREANRILAGRIVELAEWTSPVFVVVLCWAVASRLRQGTARFYDLYGFVFLAGYWLYWSDGGNRWGPRYIYPALPFMILTVAAWGWDRLREGHRFVGHVLAVCMLVAALQVPSLVVRAAELMDQTQDLRHQVREAGLHNAIVVVTARTGVIWRIDTGDLVVNGLRPDGDVIYAHPPGLALGASRPTDISRTVAALRAYFPGREIWRYERDEGVVMGRLTRQ